MDKTAGNRIRGRIKTFLDTPLGRYIVPISFIIFLVGTPLTLYFMERYVSPASSWFDDAWEFRKPVTVESTNYSSDNIISTLGTNLVAYWDMDEGSGDRSDSVGSNTLSDMNTVASATGVIDSAGDFEADNSEYLEISDNADVSTGDFNFTISAWVKLESKPANTTIIAGKYDDASNAEHLISWSNSFDRFVFSLYDNTGASIGVVSANSFGAPSLGVWHHIVAWYDTDTDSMNIQVDNGPVDQDTTLFGTPSDTSANFRLGAYLTTESGFFDGAIDEVAFWKRLLTPSEIAYLYDPDPAPLTNADVLVELDTASLIAENKIQADCDDIRFIDSDDVTPLNYWIESGCNTASTQIWVEVPSVPAEGKDIYLYYGNGSATNAEQAWSGSFTLMANGSCPAGWTADTALSDKFPRGAVTAGGTGGSSSHDHGNASCTSGGPSATQGRPAGTSITVASSGHSHSGLQVAVDSASVLPPYLDVVVCKKDDLVIPANSIAIFDSAAPAGWTRFAALDGLFPMGDVATYGGTGGSETHSHTTTGGVLTSYQSGTTKLHNACGGAPPGASHQHTSLSGSSGTGNNLPPYRDVIFGQADSETVGVSDMIAMVDALPPIGWNQFSDLDGRFPRGSASYGATGGTDTHTHSVTITTTSNSGTNNYGVCYPGSRIFAVHHNHSCSTTTSAQSNLPPYSDVIYAQRVTPQSSIVIGTEESNAPAAPTSVAAQGLSTTSVRWNFVDNSSNETGFRVYDTNDVLKVTCVGVDLTYCDESGLSPNTSYTRKIVAYNAQGESDFSAEVSRYTLVSDATLTVDDVTASGIDLSSSAIANIASGSSGVYFFCGVDEGEGPGQPDTFSQKISSGENDTHDKENQTFYCPTCAQVDISSGTDVSANYFGGFRFTGVTIPQGATITNAYMTIYPRNFFFDDPNADIYLEAVDDATDFVTTTDLVDRVETTAFASWVETGTGAATMDSPDISAPVQEVIDRAGWVSGNDIVVMIEAKGDTTAAFRAEAYEEAGGTEAAEITIEYTTGGGGADDCGSITGVNAWQKILTTTIGGVEANTLYPLQVRARNGDGSETANSATQNVYSLAEVPTIAVNTLGSDQIVLEAGNIANVAQGSSGLFFDCTSASCDTGINSWVQTSTDTVTGLASNTLYTFQVKARNGSSTETAYSGGLAIHTAASTPGQPAATQLSTSSINVVVNENANNSSVDYAVQDSGSGLYVNKTTGALQAGADWGTYAEWGDSSGVNVVGLDSGTGYLFQAKARNNDAVETGFGPSASQYTALNAPTIGSPEVLSDESIRWNFTDNEANEDGFRVYDLTDTPVTTCVGQDLTACDESGLTPNTSYSRKIAAYNVGASSEFSSTASARTEAAVPSISGGVATSSTVDLTVSMGSNPSDTELVIEDQTSGLFIDPTDGQLVGSPVWATLATIETNISSTATNLEANTQYNFRVKARNADSVETAYSATFPIYTLATEPEAPSASSSSSSSVTVVITTTGNPSDTEYAVLEVNSGEYVNKVSGDLQVSESWGTYAEFGSASGITITGLNPNTEYIFEVKARNGDDIETALSASTSVYALANVPNNVVATTTSSSVANVVFEVNGNPASTEFAIEEVHSGNFVNKGTGVLQASEDWGTHGQLGAELGAGVVGLSPNTEYQFRVKARNSDNIETSSSAFDAVVTLANAPGAPIVTQLSTSSLNLVLDTNGNPAGTHFLVEEVNSGEFVHPLTRELQVAQVWGNYSDFGSATGVDITGLDSGVSYEFRVKARNIDSIETAFSTSSSQATLLSTPDVGTPTVLSSTSIRWTFTDNEANEDGYRIYDEEDVQVAQCEGVDLSSCDEFGLTPNTSYTRTVVAYNSQANSAQSSSVTAVTLANTPNAPAASASSSTILNLEVDANNNPASTEFVIQETVSGSYVSKANGRLVSSPSWGTRAEFGGDEGVSVNRLFANAQYRFVVKARNSNSIESSDSSEVARYTLAVDPGAPSVNPTSSSQVNLVINTSGNPPLTQYSIREANSGKYVSRTAGALRDTQEWSTYQQFKGASGISISGLSVNTEYEFVVTARNGDLEESTASGVSNSYTLSNIPTRPAVQALGPSSVRVTVAGNSNPTGTEVSIRESVSGRFVGSNGSLRQGEAWIALPESGDRTIDVRGLTPGARYDFSAKARNGDGVETVLSDDAALYTRARATNVANSTAVSTTAIRLVLDPGDNDPSVQYLVREVNSGLFIDRSDGSLQANEIWGTYTEFGGENGILVAGLSPARDYAFRVRARNVEGTVTGLGAHAYTGTNAILQNVPAEINVFLKGNATLDLTKIIGGQRGLQDLRTKRGEYLVADIPILFDTNRDWASVIIDSDAETSRTAVKLDESTGFRGKFTMYVVKGNTNAFVLCPDAQNLGEVASDCDNGELFTGPFPQTKEIEGNSVSVSIAVIEGEEYWVIDGLTGTGGQGVIYEPGEEPKAPSGEEEEEPVVGSDDSSDGESTPATTTEIVTNVVNSAIAQAPEVAGQVVQGVRETLDRTVGTLPQGNLEAVANTASVATVTVGVAAVSGGITQIPYYLTQLLFGLLSFLGFRKKGKPYGYVYDSVSKKPINRAIVRIYDQKDRLIWTDVTDVFGAFNADLPAGKYKMLIRKSGYEFPSKVVSGPADYPLEPVYHGAIVSLTKKGNVRYVIPMDKMSRGWLGSMSEILRNRVVFILKQLNVLVFLAGMTLAVYTYNRYPTTENLLILAVYLPTVILLLRALLKRTHSYGTIKNKKGDPVSGIIVALKEMKFDRYLGKRVTDEDGLYQFLVPAGVYQLEILNDDYSAVKFQGGSGIVEIEERGDSVVAKNIVVKKKG